MSTRPLNRVIWNIIMPLPLPGIHTIFFTYEQDITISKLLFIVQRTGLYIVRNLRNDINFTGNYSCLKVDLIFTRDRAFYFTTVFIPGIILVTSSFITFWLEWNAVPARSMIGNIWLVIGNILGLALNLYSLYQLWLGLSYNTLFVSFRRLRLFVGNVNTLY